MKNSLKDAIKSRRLNLVIKLEPEDDDVMEQEMPMKQAMKNEVVGMEEKEESPELEVEVGDESSDDLEMSKEDIKKAEMLIASGVEPKSITDRMLVDQYKKMKG
jgi:hypothetical protein